MTYKEAVEEIDQIILEIENGELDVDNLTDKLKRARKLFDYCQKKLKTAQDSVEKILDDNQKQ